jgi:hypothetical protein
MVKKLGLDSSETLEKWRSRIDSGEEPTLNSLEQQWQTIAEHGTPVKTFEDPLDNFEFPPVDIVGDFLTWIDAGMYPRPEVVLGMAEAFHDYLDSKGEAKLEDVFFGTSRQKSGNYSARLDKDNPHLWFSIWMDIKRRESDVFISEENLAESFLQSDHAIDAGITEKDVYTFLKAHKRWEKNQ